MNQAANFGLLGVGGLLLTKALTGSSFADVAKGRPGPVPNVGSQLTSTGVAGAGATIAAAAGGAAVNAATGAAVAPTGTQKQQIAQVAARYGLSPNSLWGVYGTESSFGKDPSTSSAGAQGPFQFIPGTWAQYGTGSVQNFTDSLQAAAKYLHSLGADSNPSSPATVAALNRYNGNGGGSSTATSYYQSVLNLGSSF